MGAANPAMNRDDQPLPPPLPQPENSDFTSELITTITPSKSFYSISPENSTEVIGSLNLLANCTSTSSRVSVDLVLVIDVSGSMDGEKLDLVKKTLGFLLTQLNQNDRISIVTFSSDAKRICKLTCCDEQGKKRLSLLIKGLKIEGSTNLVAGLEYSLCVLSGRKQVNQSSAVILLTDGVDHQSYTSIARARGVIAKYPISKDYSIHTFGYGSDHDSELLNSISDIKNGGFYYIQQFEGISQAFANCLGELMSVLYDDIQISLETLNCQVPFSLTKVFSETGDNVFRLPGLIKGLTKEVIFLIDLHPGMIEQDEELNLRMVKANIKYRDVKIDEEKIRECFFEVKIRKETEEKPVVNEECLVNYFRFKSAEAIKISNEFGDMRDLDHAREHIESLLKKVKESEVVSHKLTSVLISDLESAQKNFVNESHYVQTGKVSNMKSAKSHWHKRGEDIDLYQNECQHEMIGKSEDFFQNNH